MSRLEILLSYARAGLPLLPLYGARDGGCECKAATCASAGKHPRLRFDQASVDPATLGNWHRRWPKANWGLVLSSHVVLDFDPRNGGDPDTFDRALPDTCRQKTGGGGAHFLYRAREGARYPSSAGPGVDVKCGAHALIVVEPSVHASGQRYVWVDESEPFRQAPTEAPIWLEKTSRIPRAQPAPTAQRETKPFEVERYRSMLPFLGAADEYAKWLEIGMALHDAGSGSETAFGLWVEWSRQSGKFDLTVSRAKWSTFANGGGVTAGTLAYLARNNGWRACGTDAEPTEAAWGELNLPASVATPNIPAELLPEPLASMAAAVANSMQVPSALPVFAALATVATAVQRRFEVQPKSADPRYRETLSAWFMCLLPSGATKSPTLMAMTGPLHIWERKTREARKRELAANFAAREVAGKRIERLKQQAGAEEDAGRRAQLQEELAEIRATMPAEEFPLRLMAQDVTVERLQAMLAEQGERMTLISDEGNILQILGGLYSGGAANVDALCQAFSGSPIRVDRAGRSAHLERPALSILLAIQPGTWAESGRTQRFRDSGLLARFLFALPESNIGWRNPRHGVPVPDSISEVYANRIDLLLEGADAMPGKPEVLLLDEAAHETWLRFAEEIERAMRPDGTLGELRDWAAKLSGSTARIAGLMELAERGPTARVVSQDNMQRAVALARLSIPHARAAFGLLGADGVEDDAEALLGWIRTAGAQGSHNVVDVDGRTIPGSIRRQAAKSALAGRFRTLDRFKAAAARLHEWNALSAELTMRNPRARSSPYYRVNPAVFNAPR